MDAVRSTARLLTQTALVTAAITERLTGAAIQYASERADRLSRPYNDGTGPSERDERRR
jgi:hypothetical protein